MSFRLGIDNVIIVIYDFEILVTSSTHSLCKKMAYLPPALRIRTRQEKTLIANLTNLEYLLGQSERMLIGRCEALEEGDDCLSTWEDRVVQLNTRIKFAKVTLDKFRESN